MSTIFYGTRHGTLTERRLIPELASKSLSCARTFALLCAAIGSLLTGCGVLDDSDGTSGSTAGNIVKGPLTGATVEVTDVNGITVATLSAGDDSQFSFDAPEDAAYPLIVTVIGGTDSITGESPPAIQLRSAILHSGQSNVNITPFTTLVVAAAERSEQGLSVKSIRSARRFFKNNPFGLRSEFAANPLQRSVHDQNIAELIKASETLAEVLRRTGNTLGMTADDVVQKLAADLVDNTINGAGAAGTDPKVAVVANTATAEVLVESMSGKLKVKGMPFDKAVLDNAVKTMFPERTSAQQTAAIAATDVTLKQASLATDVALAVEADPELEALSAALKAIDPSTEPSADEIELALNVQGTTLENVNTATEEATRSAVNLSNDETADANTIVDDRSSADQTDDSSSETPQDNTASPSFPGTGTGQTENNNPPPTPIPDTVPTANSDAATVEQGVSTLIDVLGNDTGIRNKPLTVKIIALPELGTANIAADGNISYRSYTDTLGVDNLTYQIRDADGDIAVGSVAITIACSSPPCDRTFSASWSRVPDATGYCLYHRHTRPDRPKHQVTFAGNPSNHPLGDSNDHRVCVAEVTSFNWTLPVHTGTDIFSITSLVGDVESDFSTEATVVSF